MWRGEQIEFWLRENGRPTMGAELGVARGRFTAHMLGAFRGLHMVAVDLWSVTTGNPQYENWPVDEHYDAFLFVCECFPGLVTLVRSDTAAAATQFADQSFDFVFVDGDHRYEGVRRDIVAWQPKVRLGGMLCGHDYTPRYPGVMQAVDEIGRRVITGEDYCWMVRA